MGQVRHGYATTTHAVRAAIQRSQASLAALSRELGINPKTVAKWRKRATVEDLKTGPKAPHSTTLSEAEEAMVVAFRRHTPLPLDDCLYALQPSIPHLTRSALHRCLQRHGISRLPDVEGGKPQQSGPADHALELAPFVPASFASTDRESENAHRMGPRRFSSAEKRFNGSGSVDRATCHRTAWNIDRRAMAVRADRNAWNAGQRPSLPVPQATRAIGRS